MNNRKKQLRKAAVRQQYEAAEVQEVLFDFYGKLGDFCRDREAKYGVEYETNMCLNCPFRRGFCHASPASITKGSIIETVMNLYGRK